MAKRTLLLDERPLIILPSLATAIGLNEAIVMQQLHYWLENENSGIVEDGRRWIYNTYAQWAANFPFWSDKTIRRIINGLEESGMILATDKFNKDRSDRTKWYSIDREAFARKTEGDCPNGQFEVVNLTSPTGQSDQVEVVNLTKSLIGTESTTETTSETTNPLGCDELALMFAKTYPRPLFDDETEDSRKKAFMREAHKIASRFNGDVVLAARYLSGRLTAYAASLYVKTSNEQFLPYGRNWLLTKEYDKANDAWHRRAKKTSTLAFANFEDERAQLAGLIH